MKTLVETIYGAAGLIARIIAGQRSIQMPPVRFCACGR
jgi:hypothetical protein